MLEHSKSTLEEKLAVHNLKLSRLRRRGPWGVVSMLLLGLLLPLLPAKNKLTDYMEYPMAALLCLLFGGVVFCTGYYAAIQNQLKAIKLLEAQLRDVEGP